LPSLAAADERAADRIALGRKLFMDRRLSRNGTMSCGMCHVPEQGFAVNELTTAVGIEGRSLRRNAPTLLNVGYNTSLFHDGRARTLEEQAWGPLLAADEMGNSSRSTVADQIARLPDYAGLFERAFPDLGLSPDTIGAALAAYQRSLVSAGSRFDRFFFKGEVGALSASERRGYVLFRGVAHCDACHTLEGNNTLFTDNEFHNLGVGLGKEDRSSAQVSVQLAPGVETKVSVAMLDSLFRAPAKDEGRYEVTRVEKDRFAYRTPTLRNVELTAPYMHDGSLATLRDVVDFYDRGGNQNPGLDDFMLPLFLTERQKEDLVAFMRALTGANVEQLARAARAAASTPSFR
jgi:cytochrome c peroxidase